MIKDFLFGSGGEHFTMFKITSSTVRPLGLDTILNLSEFSHLQNVNSNFNFLIG
jgi:hypothetical protein